MRPTKNRVKLRWNRNLDQQTTSYQVYRSEREGITRHERMIARVHHPTNTNWVEIKGEVPERITNFRYRLKHDQLNRREPVNVYVNGQNANHRVSKIDYLQGEILMKEVLPAESVLTVDYTFDGIEIIDDTLKQDAVLEYLGPPAEDKTNPTTPTNLSIMPVEEKNAIRLNWEHSSTGGTAYYYRVEACDSEGNYSSLSNEEKVVLDGGLHSKGYVVERSMDGGRSWRIAAQIPYNEYYEFGIDSIRPSPVQISNSYSKPLTNQARGEVFCSLVDYEDTTEAQGSPIYRVYARASNGAVSNPTEPVGPVYLRVPIERIVVVRKRFEELVDGEIPTIGGVGVTTVVEWFNDFVSLQFWDYADDNTRWRYAIYAVDKRGTTSIPTVFDVEIPNATPPTWEPVDVRRFPLII